MGILLTGSVSLDAGSNLIGQVELSDGTNPIGQAGNPLVVDGSAVTQPVSGTLAVSNFPVTQPVSGPLTDTELRASAVPVDGSGVTQPVSGPLTDTQLRATTVPVSGSLAVSNLLTPSDSTTGDSGTFSNTTPGATTVNGAVQTNLGYRGVYATVVTGNGTGAMLGATVQYSPDGGTTWLSLTGGFSSLVANQIGVLCVYPTAFTGAGGQGNQHGNINFPLPKLWRVQYTIGSTGNIQILAVYVNYVL